MEFNINPEYVKIDTSCAITMASSLYVAKSFGRRHSNLYESIRTIISNNKGACNHFVPVSMCDGIAGDRKEIKCYMMDATGFEMVVHRMTQKSAITGIWHMWREQFAATGTKEAHDEPECSDLPNKPGVREDKLQELLSETRRMTLVVAKLQSSVEKATDVMEQFIIAFGKCKIVPTDKPIPASKTMTLPSNIRLSDEPVSVSELAKMICTTGVNIGEMRLFQWLRDNEYLCSYGSEYNLPRQKFIEQGLFIVKTSRVQLPTGQTVEKNTTKVTQKGQEYFINKFLYNAQN